MDPRAGSEDRRAVSSAVGDCLRFCGKFEDVSIAMSAIMVTQDVKGMRCTSFEY